MIEVHKVNVVGPLMVTQAMLPLLRKGSRKMVSAFVLIMLSCWSGFCSQRSTLLHAELADAESAVVPMTMLMAALACHSKAFGLQMTA